MWELDCEESWAQKNWCLELWCWRRLLRVPWTSRRSNQSILKEISLGYSLEGLMLKLKLQYFGHLMWRVDSLEKTLMLEGLGAGGEGDNRGWDGCITSPTWWTWVRVNSRSWWWTGRPGVLWFMGSQRVGHDWTSELSRTFHCINVPQHLYPFICWWTSRLLPCPVYCKYYCNGHLVPIHLKVPPKIPLLQFDIKNLNSWYQIHCMEDI